MKGSPQNDDTREPQLDDNDPVWRLLDRAPLHEPDAWFAVRTMARCHNTGVNPGATWTSIGRVWRWALGSGLGVCLAMILMTTQIEQPKPAVTDDQKKVQEAFEVVASIDSDSDSSSSTSWQDSSL